MVFPGITPERLINWPYLMNYQKKSHTFVVLNIYFLFIMNIYVGNLNYNLSEDELRQVFEEFGEVVSAKIIVDKYSGRSKGFGFVEMSDDEEANAAIAALNDSDVHGRNIKVNKARERSDDRGGRNFR